MTSTSSLPLVLVVGATGATGGSIVRGLLASGNFRVSALTRPASQSKTKAEALRASGVEIRVGDLTDGVAKLKDILAGVDIVVSAVIASSIVAQKDLIIAAKEVGVQRFVPCDFGTPGQRGVRHLLDEKLAIRDLIKELGVPHTFIDVGWWMQLSLPLPTRSKVPDAWKAVTYALHGPGGFKMLVTNMQHIGVFVAHIVADPRTLGHAVIGWEDELTQFEAREVGERASGEADVLKAKRFHLSAEDIKRYAVEADAAVEKDPTSYLAHSMQAQNEYMHSMHVLGENTLANAKALGYLDARELYPDLPTHTLEDFAKEYYSLEEPGQEFLWV